jgi:DNA-binding MarR family transcriptional regulator
MSRRPEPIRSEIRQGRPFRSRSQEALVTLFRTVDTVRRSMAEAVAPMGLTVQQYNVLRILRGAGTPGLPTLEVASRMIEQTPGITRMMDRLEKAGWVTRERCPTDRREVHCRISPAGLDLLASLDRVIDEADRRAMGYLDDRSLEQLITLLDAVRAAHAAAPDPARLPGAGRREPRSTPTKTNTGGH